MSLQQGARLTAAVRKKMVEELDRIIAGNSAYISPRLAITAEQWLSLLRQAAETKDDAWLETQLSGKMKAKELTTTKSGETIEKAVPFNAAQTLAEAEFNRLYAAGICLVALDADQNAQVRVYRARVSANERAQSQSIEGKLVGAATLLRDLRDVWHLNKALGIGNPNSGMSVELSR